MVKGIVRKKREAREHITVVLQVKKAHRRTMKTRIYDVTLTGGRIAAGQVKWHVREHRYVFKSSRHPLAPTKSSPILKDIARFIDLLMKERDDGTRA